MDEELTPEQISSICKSADTLKIQVLNILKDQEQTCYIKKLTRLVKDCYDATKMVEYANEAILLLI